MTSIRTVIFAKAPKPGFAKTRLIPALGEEGAADLARGMLQATLASALAARIGAIELNVTPEWNSPDWEGIEIPPSVEIADQAVGDIGQKMACATREALLSSSHVILVGTDWAEVSADRLSEAAAALRETGTVLYPSADGGYVLLGLSRYSSSLFFDVPWSTNTVAERTIECFTTLGWPYHLGEMQHDIDAPGDLIWLPGGFARLA